MSCTAEEFEGKTVKFSKEKAGCILTTRIKAAQRLVKRTIVFFTLRYHMILHSRCSVVCVFRVILTLLQFNNRISTRMVAEWVIIVPCHLLESESHVSESLLACLMLVAASAF